MNTLTQEAAKVNFILADGVYPNDDPVDKFRVVIGGEEVAWAETEGEAERSYLEMLHYDGEHYQKCPDDYIPFMGEPVPYDSEADDYGLEAPL